MATGPGERSARRSGRNPRARSLAFPVVLRAAAATAVRPVCPPPPRPRSPAAAPVATEEVAPAAAATTTEVGKEEVITHLDALKVVLRKSAAINGLRRGLHETAKVLDNGTARLCLLAADCDNPEYVKLIKALCGTKVALLEIESREVLGQWCGLTKFNEEGEVRKAVKTSVAAITDFGEDSKELAILLAHVKKASA